MKKLLMFLIMPLYFFGQVKAGAVTYSILFNEDTNLEKSDIGHMYKQATEDAKLVTFLLEFNNDAMIFKMEKSILKDDINYAELFSEVDGIYFREKKDSIIYQGVDDAYFGSLVITSNSSFQWELTTETKVIDGYVCYKAKSCYNTYNGIQTFVNPVIAWYCPALPFPYGPKGYGGLPGLILELLDKRVNFGAIKLSFREDSSIDKPQKGKIISKAEYDKMYQDLDDK
jgi:GLPGLI family protein